MIILDNFIFLKMHRKRYVDIIEYTQRGMSKEVKQSIERGDDVNEQNYGGNYAICIAVERNDMTTVKLLVEAGAKLEVKSGSGVSPLGWARHNEDEEMIKYIETNIIEQKNKYKNFLLILLSYYYDSNSIFYKDNFQLDMLKEIYKFLFKIIF